MFWCIENNLFVLFWSLSLNTRHHILYFPFIITLLITDGRYRVWIISKQSQFCMYFHITGYLYFSFTLITYFWLSLRNPTLPIWKLNFAISKGEPPSVQCHRRLQDWHTIGLNIRRIHGKAKLYTNYIIR
jgi:hypothetical protein